MDAFLITLFSIAAACLVFIFLLRIRPKAKISLPAGEPVSDTYRQILSEQVNRYGATNEAEFFASSQNIFLKDQSC